jgi:8-oxo-dGTP pyrophosphatase MutT (NUDIX family)
VVATPDELVEVVDVEGRVERVVTRAEMRAGRLRHRAVAVVVRRPSDGAVLAHRRAAWKDVWPSYWDLAFGGVCGVGEAWEAAARRELAEEAGVVVDPGELVHEGDGAHADDDVAAVYRLFSVGHGGPFTFADGEVVATEWVDVAALDGWLATHQVCPDTLALCRGMLLAP